MRRLLDDQVRLLTLVGPPGAGKTRLAIMAATELADRFTDGVVLVDLSPLREAALVPSSIGAALGMREGTERVVERLKTVLSQRHVLLLLDNFEHLLSAAPLVGDLVAACPRVKVLVTSREALHLASEHRFSASRLQSPVSQTKAASLYSSGCHRLHCSVCASAAFVATGSWTRTMPQQWRSCVADWTGSRLESSSRPPGRASCRRAQYWRGLMLA